MSIRARRIASPAVHFWLASSISENLGAHQPPNRAHALHVLFRVVPPNLHLHGAIAAVEEAAHLVEERLALEVHVDAAAVRADLVARPPRIR